jgi:hypothetical protein
MVFFSRYLQLFLADEIFVVGALEALNRCIRRSQHGILAAELHGHGLLELGAAGGVGR